MKFVDARFKGSYVVGFGESSGRQCVTELRSSWSERWFVS